MKLIIDIPEEDYLKLIKTDENGEKEIPLGLLLSLWDSVKYKCTTLPKNHGRLIDADELYDSLIFPNSLFGKAFKEILDDAPTIIEADKAESEDKK